MGETGLSDQWHVDDETGLSDQWQVDEKRVKIDGVSEPLLGVPLTEMGGAFGEVCS